MTKGRPLTKNENLGIQCKISRDLHRLSKDALAASANLSRKTIQRIEQGKGCNEESKKKIASALKWNLEALNEPGKPIESYLTDEQLHKLIELEEKPMEQMLEDESFISIMTAACEGIANEAPACIALEKIKTGEQLRIHVDKTQGLDFGVVVFECSEFPNILAEDHDILSPEANSIFGKMREYIISYRISETSCSEEEKRTVNSQLRSYMDELKILGFSIGVYNKQLVSLDEPELSFDILVTVIGRESSFPEHV